MSSERFFVYLQRPDSGEWVTVGRFQVVPDAAGSNIGEFMYAPSYVAAGHAWSIDPVGLPFIPDTRWKAPRYQGLHDALRDACPDTWGQAVLRKEHALPENTPPARYLVLAGNDERWGALAVGTSSQREGRWRLSPAFDVVPNCAEMPGRLAMQLSAGRFDISRENVLADSARFGFDTRAQAERHLDELLHRIETGFEAGATWLDADWSAELGRRMLTMLGKLRPQ